MLLEVGITTGRITRVVLRGRRVIMIFTTQPYTCLLYLAPYISVLNHCPCIISGTAPFYTSCVGTLLPSKC